ncbi:hypothetical protein KSP35_08950 [Aquihabitans sp. G128]|uniref:3'-5' exonuclease n=1 Tax=Aquihabitans sp. G128 TaxID=2849779 RepID=UPI001C232040|nr:3'-5' exonuclease [Aquihabitans sp. G128]QXC62889.1 hypothetical protein KSP35_08950 [Aquihabitans sp. G128]
MGQHANIYGIDIETDTSRDALDPAVAPVLTIALSGRTFDDVFIGDEATMLRALDDRLASLAPGVLATWNGATFDLPFIAERARLLGVDLDLRLCLDRRLTLGRAPLPGHAGAYRGVWGAHVHLDTFRLFGQSPAGPWTSLRSIGRLLGVGTGGAGSRPGKDLADEALHAHAASDARLARVLAERRWGAAARLLDHVDVDEARPVNVAVQRLARQARHEGVVLRPAVAAG